MSSTLEKLNNSKYVTYLILDLRLKNKQGLVEE